MAVGIEAVPSLKSERVAVFAHVEVHLLARGRSGEGFAGIQGTLTSGDVAGTRFIDEPRRNRPLPEHRPRDWPASARLNVKLPLGETSDR
jgi:hypothetical protein